MAKKSVPIDKAVAYLRKSTDMQAVSIDRQRKQVQEYAAKHGYTITEEYIDEGIAGDEIEKRPRFSRLLADARKKVFTVILCDDQDRFGRFDSLTLGEVASPLRRAGVRLETAAQGLVDWNTFAGRLSSSILAEARKLESQALSRRLLTTLVMKAQRGERPNGYAPYGYRNGKDEHGKRTLVPDDPYFVEVVRWMFRMVAERHWNPYQIQEELRARGVAPPHAQGKGKKKPFRSGEMGLWNPQTIARLLRNRAYVGDFVYGQISKGKYSECNGGEVHCSDVPQTKHRVHPEESWMVRTGTHPAIIDRDLFSRVQSILDGRKRHNGREPGRTSLAALFSRIIVCPKCGDLMTTRKRGKDGRVYICSRYNIYGKTSCEKYTIPEPAIFVAVAEALQREFLNPDRLAELRAEMVRQVEAAMAPDGRVKELKDRLAQLDHDIDHGNSNLALLPADLVPGVAMKVRNWKQERDKTAAELLALASGARLQGVKERVEAAEKKLWYFREALLSADRELVAAALRDICDRIEPRFHTGKGGRHYLRGGVIVLREDDTLATPSGSWAQRQCRISFEVAG